MDYNQLEMQREAIFKDAVVEGAQQQALEIIAKAETERDKTLEVAYLECEQADYQLVAARYQMTAQKELSGARQSAQRTLLETRTALVEELFGSIEEKLVAYTKTPAYTDWLQTRMERLRKAAEGCASPVLYLRGEDMDKAPALCRALPGMKAEVGSFRLGGLQLQCGGKLYDETFDTLLAQEKKRFYAESGLRV